MRLLRVGEAGMETPALLDNQGVLRDLSGYVADIGPAALSDEVLDRLRGVEPSQLPELPADSRIGAPVAHVGKFLAIGLNYSDHAAEAGMPIPAEPIVFSKATSCISGPQDPVKIPPDSEKTDWEVELGIVIGKLARHISEDEALSYVAGYTLINDISERAWQLEMGGTWDKGKGYDTFGPMGPWLVTRDEIADPQNLKLWLDVNGERRQQGTTANMVFGVATIVSYLSRFMTLNPGDVIATGTPPGVGMGMKPPVFLKPGDTMKLGIDRLGEQSLLCIADK